MLNEAEKRSTSSGENRHVWVFLLEISLAIAVFAIAAAAVVTVLAAGKTKENRAEALHVVNTDVRNVEEIIRGADSPEALDAVLEQQYDTEEPSDGQWELKLQKGYVLRIVSSSGTEGGPERFTLTLSDSRGSEIQSLDVQHVMRENGAKSR